MITRRGILGAAALLTGRPAQAAEAFEGLPAAFGRIEAARGGRLGVAVLDTGSGRRAGHRQEERFPMASTFKFLASAAVLARADAGRERLDRRIAYGRQDLVPYSPVTERHVGAGMTVAELCEAAMVTSDNTAANLLLAALGGPPALTAWLRGIGDQATRLDRTEPDLNEARPGDPRDTTTPAAMGSDIRALVLGDVLASGSRARLEQWLRGNRTGDARLRAGLPAGWTAGEKTGSGRFNSANDIGLLWPPGGAAPVVVAAYLTQGPSDPKQRDAALADVARAVSGAWTAAR